MADFNSSNKNNSSNNINNQVNTYGMNNQLSTFNRNNQISNTQNSNSQFKIVMANTAYSNNLKLGNLNISGFHSNVKLQEIVQTDPIKFEKMNEVPVNNNDIVALKNAITHSFGMANNNYAILENFIGQLDKKIAVSDNNTKKIWESITTEVAPRIQNVSEYLQRLSILISPQDPSKANSSIEELASKVESKLSEIINEINNIKKTNEGIVESMKESQQVMIDTIKSMDNRILVLQQEMEQKIEKGSIATQDTNNKLDTITETFTEILSKHEMKMKELELRIEEKELEHKRKQSEDSNFRVLDNPIQQEMVQPVNQIINNNLAELERIRDRAGNNRAKEEPKDHLPKENIPQQVYKQPNNTKTPCYIHPNANHSMEECNVANSLRKDPMVKDPRMPCYLHPYAYHNNQECPSQRRNRKRSSGNNNKKKRSQPYNNSPNNYYDSYSNSRERYIRYDNIDFPEDYENYRRDDQYYDNRKPQRSPNIRNRQNSNNNVKRSNYKETPLVRGYNSYQNNDNYNQIDNRNRSQNKNFQRDFRPKGRKNNRY